MSNWVSGIIDDVLDRLGDAANLDRPKVLRAMQRIYEGLNRTYYLVEKELAIAEGDLSSTVNYVALPAGWLAPFRLVDGDGASVDFEYKQKSDWNADDTGLTLAEFAGRLWFSGVSDSSAFTIYYYSLGSTLSDVDDGDLETGEVNAVEWNRGNGNLLLYKTCLELSSDYSQAGLDAQKVVAMESEIQGRAANRQRLKSCIIGGNDVAVEQGGRVGGYKEYWVG